MTSTYRPVKTFVNFVNNPNGGNANGDTEKCSNDNRGNGGTNGDSGNGHRDDDSKDGNHDCDPVIIQLQSKLNDKCLRILRKGNIDSLDCRGEVGSVPSS